jgi:hypothetical protein
MRLRLAILSLALLAMLCALPVVVWLVAHAAW